MTTIEEELKRYRACVESMTADECDPDIPCCGCELDMRVNIFNLFRQLEFSIEGKAS